MSGWRVPIATAGLFWSLAACAKLAGLESADDTPATSAPKPSGTPFPVNQVGAEIGPTKLTIKTSCKVEDQSQVISILNKSDRTIDYEVTSPAPETVTLREGDNGELGVAVTGKLAAKQLKLIRAHVLAPSAGTAKAEILVRTQDQLQRIPVDITVSGGSLAFAPAIVDFGQVKAETTPPDQEIEIQNTGTDPVTITSWEGTGKGDFVVAGGSGSLTVREGQSVKTRVSFVPGAVGEPLSGTMTPTTQTPLCTDAPTLSVRGARVNLAVTVGPGALDFGPQSCLSVSTTTENIELQNFSPSISQVELRLVDTGAPTRFIVPSSTTVPPAIGTTPGRTSVPIGLKRIGDEPGAPVTESIQVNVKTPEPSSAVVTATVQAVGATIEIAPTALEFGANETKTFKVTNTGNATVFLDHRSNNPLYAFLDDTDHTTVGPPGLFSQSTATVKLKLNASTGNPKADITTSRALLPPAPLNGELCRPPAVLKATANL